MVNILLYCEVDNDYTARRFHIYMYVTVLLIVVEREAMKVSTRKLLGNRTVEKQWANEFVTTQGKRRYRLVSSC